MSQKFDLEERTAKFAENIIDFCKSLSQDSVSKPLIVQLVKSGTSIGANYMEANGASSKKDFRNKIFICKKEAGETKYWLRLLAKNFPERKVELQNLWLECQQLTMIFQKIINTMSEKALNN